MFFGLRFRIRAIKKEGYNFLEHFFPDIHRAVHAIARFHPIYFANRDLPWDRFAAVAEFDVDQIPAEDDRDAMERIVMPGRGFSRLEPQPAHQVIPATMQHLLLRFRLHDRGIMPQSGKS